MNKRRRRIAKRNRREKKLMRMPEWKKFSELMDQTTATFIRVTEKVNELIVSLGAPLDPRI